MVKIIALGVLALFCLAMVGLSVYLLITPPTVVETCNSTSSQTWVIFTLALALATAIAVVVAAIEMKDASHGG